MDGELPTANLRFMNQEFVKLDRFDGQNYTRWADKVKFMLVVLKLYYILDPNLPAIPDDPPLEAGEVPNQDLAKQRLVRKEAEDLCLGHIKNSLSDRLYDLYAPVTSARELWKALEDKYKAHEEGTNKYLISKYLDFQMVDDKSILEQVHELQVLVNKLTALSIPLPEIFQVGVIIAKLPPTWKDFSKRMMHKSEDYSLDELLKHLRIEEETRNRDKRGKVGSSVNHIVGGSGQKGKGAYKSKRFTAPKKKEFKKSHQTTNHQPKRSGKCHVCGETGHYARECSQRKSGSTVGSTSAIDIEKVTNLVANVGLGDVNMLSQYTRVVACRGWFLDSGATVHVCGNRGSFLTYESVPQGTVVVCADGHRVEVRGKGTVRLNFRDGRMVTLQDVLHVPGITKGLVSADKFDRNGYKMVIKNLRVKFSLNDIYVGQAKNTGGMYRLDLAEDGIDEEEDSDEGGVSVIDGFGNESDSDSGDSGSDSFYQCNAIGFDLNEIMSSDYIACSISLWHKRLAHTNIKNIEKMQTKGLLKLKDKDFEKCETCVKSKFTKKPFPSVHKRNTSLLELIHSDICELNGVLTRGGKRYFITFCDDFSRYLYVYLLHSKDEAFEAFKIYKAEVEKQKEKRIKILRSDRGGEYFNRRFDAFCEEEGIIHERTAPYTPQQNGLAERKNRTLVEMANCMLNQSGLPRNMWGGKLC